MDLLVDTNMGYLQYMGYLWIFIWDMTGMVLAYIHYHLNILRFIWR